MHIIITIIRIACSINAFYGVYISDVNECMEQLDDCHEFAMCLNLENGGFECRCLEGYEEDGRQCIGIGFMTLSAFYTA